MIPAQKIHSDRCALTSSRLKSPDSLNRRSMSRAEKQVSRSISVPVVLGAAVSANPLSLIQSRPTFRPGYASACGAGLRTKGFVDFLVPRPFSNGFVGEHRTEGRPARIIDGLRHAGFGEAGRVHITHGDVVELSDDASRELVQEVPACISCLGMQLGSKALLTGPLRLPKPFLDGLEVPRVADRLTVGQRGKMLQPEVDAYPVLDTPRLRFGNFNGDVQEPVAASVLAKVRSITDLAFGKRTTVEHAKGVAVEAKGGSFTLEAAPLNRHPSERLTTPVTQVWAAVLSAGLNVLRQENRDRLAGKPEQFAAARRELFNIESAGPLLAPLERVFLRVVRKVPNVIDRSRLGVQEASQ